MKMTITEGITPGKIAMQDEHLIGKFVGAPEGVTLVVVGSVHGNEPGGRAALRRVAEGLEKLRDKLRGRVYFLAGNTRALERGARFIDADLNRHWTTANILKNEADSSPKISEDREQRELLRIFARILQSARDEIFVLDLHSTSAAGLPFATVGDTLRNRSFAQKFPVTILLGIEEQLDGTMLEHLNNEGAVTLGFEGGQHISPETTENHESLVWLALVNSGILEAKDAPDLEIHRRKLTRSTQHQRIIEVRYRHAITPEDEFLMNPGFENFDNIRRGQILAQDRKGQIRAPESGLLLMPLYQRQGADGFFIGREVAPFWLWLSKLLRKLRIGSFVHFLPGVRRMPADAESLLVNTRVARFLPLQIFHLLGFRKRRWRGNQLIVSRRRHDTQSPFRRKE